MVVWEIETMRITKEEALKLALRDFLVIHHGASCQGILDNSKSEVTSSITAVSKHKRDPEGPRCDINLNL